MYKNVMYDTKFMREILPENLRWFECDVYVAEFRNLVIDRSKPGFRDDYSFVLANKHYIKFKLDMAEFDFSGTFPSESSLSTSETEMAKNSFGLKFGNFEIDAQINLGKKTGNESAQQAEQAQATQNSGAVGGGTRFI